MKVGPAVATSSKYSSVASAVGPMPSQMMAATEPAAGDNVHGRSIISASGSVIAVATTITAAEATRKSVLITRREITLLAA